MAVDLTIRQFAPADRDRVIELWRDCDLVRPWNDPAKDIDRKVAHSPQGLLVAEHQGHIVGAVMVGYDGHRGWANYLATDPRQQHSGIGRALMDAAESQLIALGCPKLNLQIRTSNDVVVEFYKHIDYSRDDCVSMGKRLIPDD